LITLVLGGARSGKSAVAERLVGRLAPPVTYVATMVVSDDAELAARIRAHQLRRPPEWRTVEAGLTLPAAVAATTGTILVDSLGPWVALGPTPELTTALCAALTSRTGDSVVVTEEVGMGVHPSSAEGRAFRDALGLLNHAVAAVADEAFVVIAGRTLRLNDDA